MNIEFKKKVKIIVMAKAPIPGLAKTRLIPTLGLDGSAKLAHKLLLHTIENVQATELGEIELCVTPAPENAAWDAFRPLNNLHWAFQGEGDLGQRLAQTSRRSSSMGRSVLLMGTDCPALNAKVIHQAATSLEQFDTVIVPAHDGGYALIGFNDYHHTLFENISWSTDSVLSETLQRIHALHWSIDLLPPLSDIDEADDLHYLPEAWKADFLPAVSSIGLTE